jgi:hypothetical protein
MADGRKDVCTMGCSPLDTVTMIDTSLSSLCIHIKEFQVVVKVNITSTEVTTKKGCVGCEDGSDVHVPFADEDESDTSEPFMEVSDDAWGRD